MKRILYILSIVLIALLSCKKDDVKVQTPVFNNEDIVLGTTTVQITVKCDYPSVFKSVNGVISTNSDMSNPQIIAAEIFGFEFRITFTNLNPKTMYYYYYEYSNGMDEGLKSDIWSFTTNDYYLPIVTTFEITDITTNSAVSGGNVIDNGGLEISECGICWSTNQNPTISGNHISNENGNYPFTLSIANLNVYSTYYVRAYAINEKGTSYGEQKVFKTLLTEQEGSINSTFSVSSQKRVCFSQGNLQYKASSNTWRFAENQYDIIGEANNNISDTYNGWIDLFGWGTSGYNHGSSCYQPWSTTLEDTYNAYGNASYNLYDQTGKADWGYNAISNGGNTENQWRTLTKDEWVYLFNNRNTISGIRYAKADVNNVYGVILLPDDWISSYYELANCNAADTDYRDNMISLSDWINSLEKNGAVFLPATEFRYDHAIYRPHEGYYWSSSRDVDHTYSAHNVHFDFSSMVPDLYNARAYGLSVRLVHDID